MTNEIKRKIWKRDEYKCKYCSKYLLDFSRIDNVLEDMNVSLNKSINIIKFFENRGACIDHIIPKIKGGTDEEKNLNTCCRSCNSSKGAKDLDVWKQEMVQGMMEDIKFQSGQ